MDSFSNLPPFDLAYTDLYPGSLDSMEQTYQFETSTQASTYQGMSVQTLDTSFPGYHNQLDLAENNPLSFNFLDKYDIEPLTLSEMTSETAGFFETDTPDIPTSVLDEYIPENSGNEPVNNAPSSIPDIPLIQQICLSGSEPEIREPTPEGYSNPDHPLTNLPDVLPDPKDLRPLTIVKPLNLNQPASDNQTPRAKGIVDDNASMINSKRDLYKDPDLELKRKRHREYMRELRKNPAYVEHERMRKIERRSQHNRERYLNDPDFVEQRRVYQRMHHRERYRNDPDFAERKKKRMRELRQDPIFVERKKANQRERYQKDPDFAERKKKRMRELRQDPLFAERQRERRRQRNSQLRKDPSVENGCAVHG